MSRLDIGIDLEYQVLEPSEFSFKIHAATTPRQQVSRVQLAIEPSTRFTVSRAAASATSICACTQSPVRSKSAMRRGSIPIRS